MKAAKHAIRFSELDLVRGIGILLVVVYHIFFDLTYFGFGNWTANPVVWAIGRLAAFLLIGVAGVSLSVSAKRWEGKNGAAWHHAKRVLVLAGVALLITLATWIYPHNGFIFFGIIHFLALASLVGFLLGRSRTAVALLVILSVPAWLWLQTQNTNDVLLSILGGRTGIYTLDLYAFFPWIGLFCAGMLIGDRMYAKEGRRIRFSPPTNWILELMGQNSLAFYLLHQLAIIGILMVLGIRA